MLKQKIEKQIDKEKFLIHKFVKFCRVLCNFVIKLYLLLLFFLKRWWLEGVHYFQVFNPPLYYLSGYIPNCCEALEAMLAASSIGAVWSSTSPDFGVQVCWWLGQSEVFFIAWACQLFFLKKTTVKVVTFYWPLLQCTCKFTNWKYLWQWRANGREIK